MSDLINVYMDACCFIDIVKVEASAQVEEGRELDVWYLNRLLQAHRDREITVYTSVLSIAEAVHIGKTPVPDDVQRRLETLLTSGQYVHLVQTTPFVCTDARNLRWIDGITLKGADSVHMASALDRSCSEFLTVDTGFEAHKSVLNAKGMVVAKPSETKSLPSRYLQKDMLVDGLHN